MPAIAPIAVPVGNLTSVPAQAPTSVPAQAQTPLSIGSSAAAHDYLMLLGELGKAAGLDAVGVAKAEPFASARQVLLTRKRQGLAGGMQFTYRNPARSTDPRATLPQADTLFVGALAVAAPDVSAVGQAKPQADPQGGPQSGPQAKPQGQVANYAQRDYYGQLRFGLAAVASRLEADGWQAKIVIDDNALMDREAAFRAGLGWYGKNTCLLIPRRGSQFVLGSVITDAPLPAGRPLDRTCGACSLCQQACPTGALDVAGQLDARRCLAWLLQQAGVFPRQHRAALGNRFYGCDSCQSVCPVGKSDRAVGNSDKAAVHGREPGVDGTDISKVDILALLSSTDEKLLRKYGRFYIPKRQPRYLRRNALVVLGNLGDPQSPEVRKALIAALADADPIIRAHAVWVARTMGLEDLAEAAKLDPDARVREEARLPVEARPPEEARLPVEARFTAK